MSLQSERQDRIRSEPAQLVLSGVERRTLKKIRGPSTTLGMTQRKDSVQDDRLVAELAAFGPGTTEVFPVSAHTRLISLQYLVAAGPNLVRSQVAGLFSLRRSDRGISS